MRWLASSLLVIALGLGSAFASAQEAPEPTPPKEAPAPPSEPDKDDGAKDEPEDAPKDGSKEERKPHPEPRVIIDVSTKKKTKTSEAIQAAARRGFWGKTVGCYKKFAWEDPELEVDVTLRVDVRGGAIKKATVQKAPAPKKKPKTKKKTKAKSKTSEVAACLAKRAVGLSMPKGIRTATSLRVQIYPGDDPIPPPPPPKKKTKND